MMNKEILDFIIEAKRNTYAGKNNQVESSRDGSIDYEYIKGDYKYRDSYIGSNYFSGQEIVWVKDNPYWSMNYIGKVTDEPFSGDFLKEALRNNTEEMMYRGPKLYENGDYTYLCNVDGNPEWFEGRELIFYKNIQIYELKFHGGIIS